MKPTTLEKILKATKLAGKKKEVLVSQIYVDIIAEREYSFLGVIKKEMGEINLPEDSIQEAYQREAINDSFKMVELYKATGIRPPEEVIQEAYLRCIKKSGYIGTKNERFKSYEGLSYDGFKQLIKTFKSKPSKRVVAVAEGSCYHTYDPGSSSGLGPFKLSYHKDNEEWRKLKKFLKTAGVDFED